MKASPAGVDIRHCLGWRVAAPALPGHVSERHVAMVLLQFLDAEPDLPYLTLTHPPKKGNPPQSLPPFLHPHCVAHLILVIITRLSFSRPFRYSIPSASRPQTSNSSSIDAASSPSFRARDSLIAERLVVHFSQTSDSPNNTAKRARFTTTRRALETMPSTDLHDSPVRENAADADRKAGYKSWKKKYRKMRITFDHKMHDSEELHRQEEKASATIKRLAIENECVTCPALKSLRKLTDSRHLVGYSIPSQKSTLLSNCPG